MSEHDPKERVTLVGRINDRLKKGIPAYEVLAEIQSFPRPIVVDFNNVLANNIPPIVINPEAPSFLAQLRQIGDVFIVTTAEDWQGVHEILEKGGAWSLDQVLMTMPNWIFMTQHEEDNLKGKELRAAYIELARSIGLNYTERGLVMPPGYKYVAPIFSKPWRVPLIDDSRSATWNNPGMLGIRVKAVEPQGIWQEKEEGRLTLPEVVQAVRQSYP